MMAASRSGPSRGTPSSRLSPLVLRVVVLAGLALLVAGALIGLPYLRPHEPAPAPRPFASAPAGEGRLESPSEATGAPAAGADVAPAGKPLPAVLLKERRERVLLQEQVEAALDRTRRLHERLVSQRVSVWGGPDLDTAESLTSEGHRSLTAGHHAAALSSYETAIKIFERLADRVGAVLADNLADGERALVAGDATAAAAAYNLAQHLAPGDAAAARGLARAAVLDALRPLLAQAARDERHGDLQAAAHAYEQAAHLDPFSTPARDGALRVRRQRRDQEFAAAMSDALAALDRHDPGTARAALAQAAAIDPDAPQVADVLMRVEAMKDAAAMAHHREEAVQSETEEKWEAARAAYGQVLAIDPTIRFAQDGRSRTHARADLAARLDYHLSHPDRLADDAVQLEVDELLAEAGRATPVGERHRQQVEQLTGLYTAAMTPVTVTLASDDKTDVTIYQVGHLGAFTHHELQLRPGVYTVVGKRGGYQNVRLQLRVVAGETPEPLVVRCEKRI